MIINNLFIVKIVIKILIKSDFKSRGFANQKKDKVGDIIKIGNEIESFSMMLISLIFLF